MALEFTDNGSSVVNFGSSASIDSPTMTAATLMFWVYPLTVANALRQIVAKKGAANTGWIVIKRGSDGTAWAWLGDRATTDAQVDLTGVQANVWQFMAFQWEVSSNTFKSFIGTLTAKVAEVSASVVNGSGAQIDDSAENLTVGLGNQTPAGMRMKHLHLVNRLLTLGQIEEQRYVTREPIQSSRFSRHLLPGSVLYSEMGYGGTLTQYDWSGTGNSGTGTAVSLAVDPPVMLKPRRRIIGDKAAAAVTAIRHLPLDMPQFGPMIPIPYR